MAKMKRNALRNNSLSKQFMLRSATVIAEKIVAEKKKNNGRVPWGFAANLLKQGRETFPKMSMRTINNYIKKIEEESIAETNFKGIISVRSNSGNSGFSTLTDSLHLADSIGSVTNDQSSINGSTTGESNGSTSESNGPCRKSVFGGRPKGSTVGFQLDVRQRIEAATKHATDALGQAKHDEKTKGKGRVAKGLLTTIINDAKAMHNLDDSVVISEDVVRQRVKRKSNNGKVGPKAPLLQIEPYIVSLIIQLANMRVPITASQGLQLCNSIIKGTKFGNQVVEYKKKMCRSVSSELGLGYWRGFMKRNGHLIAAKKAVKFDTKRSEWCSYSNMEEMYNEVYSSLVTAGLAVKHDEPVWRNAAGDVVAEEEALGQKSAYELIHPEMLVFVDEVGSNTSQTKDGHVGGQTYLCTKEGRPLQRAATKDAHFTVLGFTAANGKPLMWTIIFAAKSVKDEWKTGFNPFVQWIGEEHEIEKNMGEGKALPLGPECMFNDKNIPCFCCCSDSCTIMGILL
jgi:hypothetical protein